MLHWIGVIVIGFIAGVIAKFIMPGGNEPSGFIMTTVLGIAGSFLANFVAAKLGLISSASEGGELLSGIVGAVILLAIYHFAFANRGTTTI